MWKLGIVLLTIGAALAPLTAQTRPTHQVRDLGVLAGYEGSAAIESNWAGLVTGSHIGIPTGPPPVRICHAFVWNALTGMRDLGTLGETCATGRHIDALGRVGGTLLHLSPSLGYRSFFWSLASGMIDIGSLAGGSGDATLVQAMNARGEMVGFSQEGQYSMGHYPFERAFFWSRATGIKDLGSLGGLGVGRSIAAAINASGRIAGLSFVGLDMAVGPHAVYWASHSSPILDLGVTLGIPGESRAFQINNRNQIAGDRLGVGARRIGIFIANPASGPVVEIGDLGFITSGTRDINDAGQVAGTINLGASFENQVNRGFRWTPPATGPAVMEQIPPLVGDTETAADSINARGQVAGSSFLRTSGQTHAIIWTPATGTVSLPSLVPGGSCQALDISDVGLISGWCTASDGKQHAVVWARTLHGLFLFP